MRVSTTNQEVEGTSLDSQLEGCLAKAKDLGCEVPDNYIFREVYSGLELEDRPEMVRLRQAIRNGEIQILIAHSLERISRDPVHNVLIEGDLDKAGVNLVLVTEDHDSSEIGKLVSYVKSYGAKLEAQRFKERSQRGRATRAKMGKLLGGRATKLYGYSYIPGKATGEGKRQVEPAEAEIVGRIFRDYGEGSFTLRTIARALSADNIRTPSGSDCWNSATLFAMLNNLAYTGKTYIFTQRHVEGQRHIKAQRKNKNTHIEYKPEEEWVELPDATPRIISDGLFEACQVKLKANKDLKTDNVKGAYLLRGFLYCEHCGHRYQGAIKRVKSPHGVKEYRYYRCQANSIMNAEKCLNDTWKAEELEQSVWAEVERALSNPEQVFTELQRQSEEYKTGEWQTQLDTINRRLDNRQKQLDRIWRGFAISGDEDSFKLQAFPLQHEMDGLKAERKKMEKRIADWHQERVDLEDLEEACLRMGKNLANLTFEQKRLALGALQIKVTINARGLLIDGVVPAVEHKTLSTPY